MFEFNNIPHDLSGLQHKYLRTKMQKQFYL